ncbi:hypothetical protein [Streptomyces sasae]|uniref:hypothetical protein n=1 Tax=Streptomyces sasae TaxID=1266772 RepID=UPI00292EFB90|nr:hypothetical protein [Streptomyces sasae]
MTEGLKWIGRHTFDKPAADGMLGGISMTAMRGVPVRDLLLTLGADEKEISSGMPYRDFHPTRDAPCMYGTSGEWAYVLEDRGSCTWCEWFFEDEDKMRPTAGDELICLNANIAVNPSYLVYAPGDGNVYLNNFGDDLTDRLHAVEGSKLAALGEGLKAAGATCPEGYTVPQWHDLLDAQEGGLRGVVWQAVGDILGIRIPRADVEQGRLPAARLTGPYT